MWQQIRTGLIVFTIVSEVPHVGGWQPLSEVRILSLASMNVSEIPSAVPLLVLAGGVLLILTLSQPEARSALLRGGKTASRYAGRVASAGVGKVRSHYGI